VAIILPPQPWTRQPQIPVGVNPTKRLLGLWSPGINAQGAGPLLRGTPTDVTRGSIIPLGIPGGFNGSSSRITLNKPLPNSRFTVMAGCVMAAGSQKYLLSVNYNQSGDGIEHCTFRLNSDAIQATYYNGTVYAAAVTGPGAGVYATAFALIGAAGVTDDWYAGYVNASGQETISSAASTPAASTRNARTAWIGCGANDSSLWRFYDDRILWVGIFDGWLSASERQAYALNPWQLFAPLPRRIFVGPSSGPASYTLTANAGSYTLSGQTADLARSKLLTANAGSYSLSGQTADLTWAASSAYTLTANPGAYTLAGQTADLTWASPGAYVLTANAGAYTVSGQTASLLKSNLLTANAGAYTFAGQTADLTKSAAAAYTLTANAGAYTLAGQGAVLTNSGEVIPVVTQGPTFGISWGALVRKTWGKEWAEPEWDYQFSNGRRFKEKKNPYS